ncbi:hypothetical protein Dimus_030279 [Dionaea muscipula]
MQIGFRLFEGDSVATMFGEDPEIATSSRSSWMTYQIQWIKAPYFKCSPASVAIRKTNDAWIKDKELKVKVVDFARKIERKWIGRDRPIANRMDWQDANQHWNNGLAGGNGNAGNRTSIRPYVHDLLIRVVDSDENFGFVAMKFLRMLGILVRSMLSDNTGERVTEEQAVLIFNTDFRCQCICHVRDISRNSSGRSSSANESIDMEAVDKEENLVIMRIIDHEHAGILSHQVADGPTRGFDDDIRERNQARILREDNVEKVPQDRSSVDRRNTSSSSINGSHYELRQSVGCEGTLRSLNGGVFLESGVREVSNDHNEVATVDAV